MIPQRVLAEAQNWRCAYCGGAMQKWPQGPAMATREHLTPRAFGGSDEPENLIAACQACNMARGRLISAEDFHAFRQDCMRDGVWPPLTEPVGGVRLHLWAMSRRAENARRTLERDRLTARSRKIGKIRAAHAREERAAREW